jgi:hypothetical protein
MPEKLGEKLDETYDTNLKKIQISKKWTSVSKFILRFNLVIKKLNLASSQKNSRVLNFEKNGEFCLLMNKKKAQIYFKFFFITKLYVEIDFFCLFFLIKKNNEI